MPKYKVEISSGKAFEIEAERDQLDSVVAELERRYAKPQEPERENFAVSDPMGGGDFSAASEAPAQSGRSVLDGFRSSPAQDQANADKRLSYGAGPISRETAAKADAVRSSRGSAGQIRPDNATTKKVVDAMDAAGERSLGDMAASAKQDETLARIETELKAERDRKFAEESPVLSALGSGAASTLAGALNAPAAAADFFNQSLVNPVLRALGMSELPRAANMPGVDALNEKAALEMPRIGSASMSTAMDRGELGKWLGVKLSAAMPQVAQSLAATMVPPLRAVLLPGMGATAAGQSFAEGDDSRVSAAKGVVEGLTEMLPLGVFDALKRMPPAKSSAVLAVAGQKALAAGGTITATTLTNAIEESVAQVGNNALDKYFQGKDVGLLDSVEESAVVGGLTGAALGVPQAAAVASGKYSPEGLIAAEIDAVGNAFGSLSERDTGNIVDEMLRTEGRRLRPESTSVDARAAAIQAERDRIQSMRRSAPAAVMQAGSVDEAIDIAMTATATQPTDIPQPQGADLGTQAPEAVQSQPQAPQAPGVTAPNATAAGGSDQVLDGVLSALSDLSLAGATGARPTDLPSTQSSESTNAGTQGNAAPTVAAGGTAASTDPRAGVDIDGRVSAAGLSGSGVAAEVRAPGGRTDAGIDGATVAGNDGAVAVQGAADSVTAGPVAAEVSPGAVITGAELRKNPALLETATEIRFTPEQIKTTSVRSLNQLANNFERTDLSDGTIVYSRSGGTSATGQSVDSQEGRGVASAGAGIQAFGGTGNPGQPQNPGNQAVLAGGTAAVSGDRTAGDAAALRALERGISNRDSESLTFSSELAAIKTLSAKRRNSPQFQWTLKRTGDKQWTLSGTPDLELEFSAPSDKLNARFAQAAAKIFKTPLYFIGAKKGSLDGYNAFELGGRLYINAGGTESPVVAATMHEIGHTLPPDLKAEMIDGVLGTVTPEQRAKFLDQFSGYKNESEAKQDEELVMRIIEQDAQNEEFWQALADRMGDSKFSRLAKSIIGTLDRLIAGFRRDNSSEFTTDIVAVRKIVADAYARAEERLNGSAANASTSVSLSVQRSNGADAARPATERVSADDAVDRQMVGATAKRAALVSAASLEGSNRVAQSQSWNKGRDLKVAIQQRVLDAAISDGLNVSEDSPQTRAYLLQVGLKDAVAALKQNPNAIGWYDLKTRQALAVMALVHPEIAKDENARFAFTWALAVTSNGLKVGKNFELAEQVYAQYKTTGTMPSNVGIGTAGNAINDSLALFNKLRDEWGMDNLRAFMQTNFTVSEITGISKELKPGGEHADVVVKGAAILGPKIGNGFFSNLYGNFDSLTMDRWLVRTWGRWTGTLIQAMPENTAKARGRLKAAVAGVISVKGESKRLGDLIGVEISADSDIDVVAEAVKEASVDPSTRSLLNNSDVGLELRKAGNSLAKYLDGQKEAPQGPTERKYIRALFGDILAELRRTPGYEDLTMADLQAVLWYAEKRLYETAKEDQGELESDDAVEGYSDEDAPDYANAAADVARSKGVTDRKVTAALRRIEDDRAGRARPDDESAAEGQRRQVGAGGQQGPARGFAPAEKRRFIGERAILRARANRASDAQSPGAYSGDGGTDGPRVRVLKSLGVSYTQTWKVDRSTGTVFRANEIAAPEFLELAATAENANRFAEAITQAKADMKFGAAVYVYPAEQYKGMRLFLSKDGLSGVAVKPDGDIVSVFSTNGGGRAVMELAVSAGGRKLDAFDTILPEFYAPHGFKAVSRLKWDDSQAPDGWSKEAFARFNNGEPDVVFMVYDPKKKDAEYTPKDGRTFTGEDAYDRAVAAQNREARKVERDSTPAPQLSASRKRTFADVADDLNRIATRPEFFTYPKSSAKDFSSVLADVAPSFTAQDAGRKPADVADAWKVYTPSGQGPAYVIQYKDGKVELNVSNLREGDGGSALYTAVGNYAANTGLVFTGDRFGLSQAGAQRRLDNMISLALKFGGRTDFMEPHPDQAAKYNLKWEEGNDRQNLAGMVEARAREFSQQYPQIRDYTFDWGSSSFKSLTTGMGLDEQGVQNVVRAARAASLRVGERSVKAAILVSSLEQPDAEGARGGVLEGLDSGQPLPPDLVGISYSRARGSVLDRFAFQGYERADVPRIQSARKLKGLLDRLDAGQITGPEFELQARILSQRMTEASEIKSANRLTGDRERGADIVREKLIAARRRGDLDFEAVEFALWAIDRNPLVLKDLGISVRAAADVGVAGDYNPASRIIRLFKGSDNTGTAVHEILHHSERLMPQVIQDGIIKEWGRAYAKALRKATPEQRKYLQEIPAAMAGSSAAAKLVREGFGPNGGLDYDAHYQLVNPSEFWAVNATEILRRRFEADSWIAKAKQWLGEMAQKIRGLLGLPTDAPVLRGIEAVMRGDGERLSPKMLSQSASYRDIAPEKQVDTPEFKRWFGDSKVVDTNGEPLVVYHSTEAARVAENQGVEEEFDAVIGSFYPQSYFSANPKEAQSYAMSGQQTYPVYLSIKNPYETTNYDEFAEAYAGPADELEREGYDGIIFRAPGEAPQFLVFDPTQIKSAIGNNGDFDPANADMNASRKRAPLNYIAERDELGNLRFGLGSAVYRRSADIANVVLDKLAMKPISPELSKSMTKMKAEIERSKEKTAEVAKAMSGLTEYERQMISDVIEGELQTAIVPPRRVLEIAAAMQQIMSNQTAELKRLGMISEETASRWDGKYLPRFYEMTLGKEMTAWAKAVKQLFSRPRAMLGIGGKNLKSRGLWETVPADELESWLDQGWEVRDPDYEDGSSTEVRVWRDYTRGERESMGEIRDSMFRFAMGYNQAQRDISLGKLFEELAATVASKTEKDGYVQVPSSTLKSPVTVKTYGKLAGKWVPKEVLDHLSSFDETQRNGLIRFYQKALSYWKEGKVVLNPVSHANNVLSNLTMAHFAGVPYYRGDKYALAMRDLIKGVPMVQEAKDAGLFVGSFNQAELVKSLPEELRVYMTQTESQVAKRFDQVWSLLTYFLRKPMAAAYEAEDQFFRFLLYKEARGRGLSPEDSVAFSTSHIFNYDDLPKGAQVVRDTALPFFAYTYKVIPVLARTALEYPHRFVAPAAILYTVNTIFYAMAAADDDDDWKDIVSQYFLDESFRKRVADFENEERKNLPPWLQGASASLGTPKAIRLGMDEATNLPVFLDVSKIFPGGDLLDFASNAGGVPFPQPITPSSPVLSAAAVFLFNKDPFYGKDVVDINDDSSEAAKKRAEWAWKQFSPAIAVGNYHYDRVMNVVAQTTGEDVLGYTGRGKDGLPVDPAYAAMQTFGIKARPIDLEKSADIQRGQENKVIRSIEAEIRQIRRLENRGAITSDRADRQITEQREKIQSIREGNVR